MKFSILLPTRNRIELLRYAVESVRMQDWDDWEIVVSDNDSADDVPACVASYGDRRIRCVRTPRLLPVTENWNHALRHAEGEWLVMLGDDDALMPGYLRTMAACVERYDPDVIYADADQFAYPSVIPGHPSAFVQRGYTEFLRGRESDPPFWLGRADALALVRKSMSFRVAFGFNMQHYLISRRILGALASAGTFFQSPYPDYYAANALLLMAERILVVPQALVVIGISAKSFGYYYANDRASEGDAFLNNAPEPALGHRLQDVILPGNSLNSSWLYAMELVKQHFDPDNRLRIDYRRYRLLQVHAAYSRSRLAGTRLLLRRLPVREALSLVLLALAVASARYLLPGALGKAVRSRLRRLISPYPEFDLMRRAVAYRNILELVRAADRDAATRAVTAPRQ